MIDTLAIAPHPDDEVLAAGGTLRKLANAGKRTAVVTVTVADGKEYGEDVVSAKREEAYRAHEVLGVSESRFLDLPTKLLDTLPLEQLIKPLASALRELRPKHVIVNHSTDIHVDHRRVFDAAMVALRPYSYKADIWAAEIPSSTEWGAIYGRRFDPNVFVDITSELDDKMRAMACYETEARMAPHPRSVAGIGHYAHRWGSEANCDAAEPFQLLRAYR